MQLPSHHLLPSQTTPVPTRPSFKSASIAPASSFSIAHSDDDDDGDLDSVELSYRKSIGDAQRTIDDLHAVALTLEQQESDEDIALASGSDLDSMDGSDDASKRR